MLKVLMLVLLLVVGQVVASPTTGLPWDGPVTRISEILASWQAYVIVLATMAVCGWCLFRYGHGLADWAKRAIWAVIVLCVVLVALGALPLTFMAGK
jgi:type IV secretory pathway VirB2 component (pilin)